MERRIVTVLFADLVGFTPLSERLDAEDVSTIQDAYFATVRETIGRYGGQLEKFIGDAAMAVFGLPRTRDDDAERAVRAGLALVNAVEGLASRLGLEAGDLRIRVGVNTGEVISADPAALGGPPADGAADALVTGDAVNTAARLQAAAPAGRVLLGEASALAVAESVELEPLEPIAVKGKTDPLRVSLAVAIRPVRSRELAMGGLRAPLIGRSDDLRRLQARAEGIHGGGAERLLVVAPPGVGKSRLVDEFLRRLDGFGVLRARLPAEAVSPFGAIIDLLRGTTGLDPADRTVLLATLLRAGVPAGRANVVADEVRRLADPQPGATVRPSDQAALFDAWATMLDAAGVGRPAVWLIEDLHWADPDLLSFLELAGRQPSRAGRLILATGRPAILERVARPGDRAGLGWPVLELGTLAPHAADELVTALIGGALPQPLGSRVVAASDGNPLFIEELLRTWASVGLLVQPAAGQSWRLAAEAHEISLPATVQAIYAAQLDDLPSGARSAARRAAVAGRRFPVAALAALDVPSVEASLATLERRALIGGLDVDPITGPGYAYRHALLRDAGYASLSRAERARLHVRLARWLERTAGERRLELAEQIGDHFAAALESTPALATEVSEGLDRPTAAALAADWLEQAGDLAAARFASEAARVLYLRSLDLSTGAADGVLARRLRRAAEATARAADLDSAAELFERSAARYQAALAHPSSPDPARADARRGYAAATAARSGLRFEEMHFAQAREIAEAALAVTGEGDPHAAVPLQLARLNALEGLTNDYGALHAEAQVVARVALETADPELIFEARRGVLRLGHSAGRVGPDEWLEFGAEAGRLERWPIAASALANAASLMTEPGDRDRVRALLDEAQAIAEARALTEQQGWIHQARCELELEAGDWPLARLEGIKALDLADARSYDRIAVRTWFALSPIAAATGDLALLGRATDWFTRRSGSFPTSPYGTVMRAAVDLRLAEAGLAEPPELPPDPLLDAIGLGENAPSWLASVETIVGAWLERGEIGAAETCVGRYLAVDVGPVTPLLAASRALAVAMVASHRGPLAAARATARTAVELAGTAQAPWWLDRATALLVAADARRPRPLAD